MINDRIFLQRALGAIGCSDVGDALGADVFARFRATDSLVRVAGVRSDGHQIRSERDARMTHDQQ